MLLYEIIDVLCGKYVFPTWKHVLSCVMWEIFHSKSYVDKMLFKMLRWDETFS